MVGRATDPAAAGAGAALALPGLLRPCPPAELGTVLQRALEALPPGSLPLWCCTTQGGLVDDRRVAVTVLAATQHADALRARIGVFFEEVVGGCSCGDEPQPQPAYCELRLVIERPDGALRFEPAGD